MAKKTTVVEKPIENKEVKYKVLSDFQYNGMTWYPIYEFDHTKYTQEELDYLAGDKNRLKKPVIKLL